jgi:hypothetical protein
MLFDFGGLLNCLFKVYVFMVCRTRRQWFLRRQHRRSAPTSKGGGEPRVYLICIHFRRWIVLRSAFFLVYCRWQTSSK